jgi:single-stranded-DNA-specific exonuclease
MPRSWLPLPAPEVPPALREAIGGHTLVARLLVQRGLREVEQARAFLDPAFYPPTSPWELPGMEQAIAILRRAMGQGAPVRVWGDFDADGQTATAVLVETLSAAGAQVDYDLPRRDEGHGLPPRAIAEALRDGIAILITCDTGINDATVVAQGVAAGLTILITDHHDLPADLPPAQALLDPKMLPDQHPLRELSGAGVAYLVARALLGDGAAALERTLDLVALGLVADVATQVGEVRYLVQRGLAALRATERPGLLALARLAQLDLPHLDEQTIGFQLGPRLNAAGRLADARSAVRLLLTQDRGEAEALAQELETLNLERQARTEAVQMAVEELLAREADLLRQPALVVVGENWEPGVLGLVAGELAQRYDRPAVLIARRPGQPSVGSARSVEGIDIHAAILSQREHLLREGGHPMAAGFSLLPEREKDFRRGLLAWMRAHHPERRLPPLEIAAEIPWEEIGLPLAQEVLRLAPFGPGNPQPVFMTAGGILVRVEDVSRRRATPHRHLYLDDETGRGLRATWFNAQELPQPGERIDLAFRLAVNYWRGQARLQVELVDWRPAAPVAQRELAMLIAGREVVDWRAAADAAERLAQLRQRYGPQLILWAEGLEEPPEGAITRATWPEHPAIALAILTAPPGPEALRWALRRAQPQEVYLLPPLAVPEPTPAEFLRAVAGMLRVALRAHGGLVDPLRMAARIGAREEAIIAALRGLEAAGKVVLRREAEGLRAYPPEAAPPPEEAEEPENPEEQAERLRQAEEQARHALGYLLRETRAYRQAYASQPVAALIREDIPRAREPNGA